MTFLKLPRIDRKSKKQIGWYYQFRLYNPKTRRTEPVPVASLPTHIRVCSSDEVAQTYCDKKNTEEERVRHRSQMRIAWIKKHYDFTKLLDNFTVAHQVNAPNSWGSTVHYLTKFVFHFFLDHMEANNIGNWSLYFDDFRRWLQTTKPLKYGKSKLAYSTMNGCIKALNVFLNWTATTGQGKAVAKCPVFPRHMLRVIGADDVLDNSEIKLIYKKLLNIRKISAELYLVLANTGMRINESLGLSLAFLHEGDIEGPKAGKIHRILRKYNLRYYGFICLESQPSLSLIRDAAGTVPRKPLKTKKAIHPKTSVTFRF